MHFVLRYASRIIHKGASQRIAYICVHTFAGIQKRRNSQNLLLGTNIAHKIV